MSLMSCQEVLDHLNKDKRRTNSDCGGGAVK